MKEYVHAGGWHDMGGGESIAELGPMDVGVVLSEPPGSNWIRRRGHGCISKVVTMAEEAVLEKFLFYTFTLSSSMLLSFHFLTLLNSAIM